MHQEIFNINLLNQHNAINKCRLKFEVQISDLSDSIKATVFAAVSEQFYGLTGKDVDTTNMDVYTRLLFFSIYSSLYYYPNTNSTHYRVHFQCRS